MPNGMYGGVRGGLNSPYSIFVDVVCQRLKRHIIHALAQRFIKSHLSRIVSTTAMPEAGITHFEGVK